MTPPIYHIYAELSSDLAAEASSLARSITASRYAGDADALRRAANRLGRGEEMSFRRFTLHRVFIGDGWGVMMSDYDLIRLESLMQAVGAPAAAVEQEGYLAERILRCRRDGMASYADERISAKLGEKIIQVWLRDHAIADQLDRLAFAGFQRDQASREVA